MNHIEDELKQALRRTDAPETLLPGIMSKLPVTSRTVQASWTARLAQLFRAPWVPWAATACAACLVLMVTVLYYRVLVPEMDGEVAGKRPVSRATQVEQGQKAKEQLMIALHIASEKLSQASRAVSRDDK